MKKRSTSKRAKPAAASNFPIVAIGASAGGLDALQQFLNEVRARSGMAFVVIQHLDPKTKGMLVELLARGSSVPVVQVVDGMRVKPDQVHVMPPNTDMSIVNGVLHLLVPVAPRGMRLPIDFFFRSLASDLQDRSVGVILSGMGSDGTLGVRAIREAAGAVFVQDPAGAKFDGMPRSAIDAGFADVIAPVAELPAKIVEYLKHAPHTPRPASAVPERELESAVEKVVGLLRTATRHDFSLYKRSTLYRRIERRMGIHQIDAVASYLRYLRENPKEIEQLFEELLIGVTSFFRDREIWARLAETLPALLATCEPKTTLRAWVPACSTGEEAYTLGMIMKEALDAHAPDKHLRLQIFATDLDAKAVEKARRGFYPANVASDVSKERLARFFVEEDHGYRVRKELRDVVIFATHNILQDPPFTKLDVVTCRNLLIYLVPELQRKLIPLFQYSLRAGGLLLLGSAETIGTATDRFAPVNAKARLYRRLEVGMTAPLDFPATFARTTIGATAPPSHVKRGRAAAALLKRKDESQRMEEELESANEEMQSANEELQSTNEELTTSKEEMQSMNEELQTLNAELQAKVEELSHASNDMKNLLDSTEIAIVFLDNALRVRRFTPKATAFFKLIPGDIGRPLADLASELVYPALYDDAREVLRALVFKEKTVTSADNRTLSVRIMPYRTNDNRIDGVVITFTNVRATKGFPGEP